MNFIKYHVSKNLLNVQGSTSIKSVSITVNNDNTITDRSIASGAADRIYWEQEFDSGTYTFSANTDGGITKIRVYSNKEFAGGTYNQFYNGWYCNVDGSLTFTINDSFIFGIIIVGSGSGTVSNIMLSTGSQPLPYEPYSSEVWHDIPHYIHNTATDTITTLPAMLYPNAAAATVDLKGNTVQSGTPTPENPIMPQGTGERTGNLFDKSTLVDGKGLDINGAIVNYPKRCTTSIPINVSEFNDVTISFTSDVSYTRVIYALFNGSTLIRRESAIFSGNSIDVSSGNSLYICFYETTDLATITSDDLSNIMLNLGSTPLPYEPYGIKIPISSAGQTTPVYLGEVGSTRRIKKLVLDGSEPYQWGHSSTRLYSWYIIATDLGATENTPFLCTHGATVTSASDFVYGTVYCDNTLNIGIFPDNLNSESEVKQWLATQAKNGTPVIIWYILTRPTTAIVNEPLMRIGDYADTVSGITIPTITGANTLSVDTTLQPSEVTVNYKGWHPLQSVHEYDSNYTIATMQTLTIAQLQTHTISELQGGEWL